jgi:hypothetical protein
MFDIFYYVGNLIYHFVENLVTFLDDNFVRFFIGYLSVLVEILAIMMKMFDFFILIVYLVNNYNYY